MLCMMLVFRNKWMDEDWVDVLRSKCSPAKPTTLLLESKSTLAHEFHRGWSFYTE